MQSEVLKLSTRMKVMYSPFPFASKWYVQLALSRVFAVHYLSLFCVLCVLCTESIKLTQDGSSYLSALSFRLRTH
jgi:hypothetical protein